MPIGGERVRSIDSGGGFVALLLILLKRGNIVGVRVGEAGYDWDHVLVKPVFQEHLKRREEERRGVGREEGGGG